MNTDDQPALVPHLYSGGERRSYPFATALTWLLTIFLILFPKGGVKIAGIPFTWGYMLIASSLPVLLSTRLIGFPLVFRRSSIIASSSLLPFLLLFLYSCRQNGINGLGSLVSDVVSLFVLPFTFLLVYPAFYPRLDGVLLSRLFRFSILAAAIFGLVLFALYPLTHQLIEVPYLTVNADDYGLIELTKHINRGYFLKLISTYNNGNVYGVATLILLPLYSSLEKRAWRRYMVRLALMLTLSRTVWAGLIVEQLLSLLRLGVSAAQTFPRVVASHALKRGSVLIGTLVAVFIGSILAVGNIAFLFDRDLGGRRAGVDQVIQSTTLLPSVPVGGFVEIIYLSALSSFGVLGFLAFSLIFLFPIVLLLSNPGAFRSPLRLAAFKGLMIYMIVAWSDGAINLIPVMAFYWFAYMIFLEGWPGEIGVPASGTSAKVGETRLPQADTLKGWSGRDWSASPL